MHRILLVEDSSSSVKVVQSALDKDGFDVLVASTVAQARQLIDSEIDIHLVLLDLIMPDGDGLALLSEWREHPRMGGVPVLLFTAKEDVETKVSAYQLGAEDYIVKPVSPRELAARVHSRLRKATPAEVLRRGRLALHFPLMKATILDGSKEVPVDLTAKEFRLVATLAQNEGQVFTRTQLVRAIWGDDMHVVNRTIDSHICGARRKLGDAGNYIQSVTGAGYRFSVHG